MKRLVSALKDCHGSITVTTIILMFVFVGLLAFVIDLSHIQNVKTELGNAADDCSLRGARGFFPDEIPGFSEMLPSATDAVNKATEAISDNRSDNQDLTDLPGGDIQVGIWDYVNKTLLAWEWPPPSSLWGEYIGPGIRVTTRREGSNNTGPVNMTLAKVFSIETVSVHDMAIAALSGLGGVHGGTPVLPFGPWVYDPSGLPVGDFHGQFRNDTDDTIGWTNLQPLAGDKPHGDEHTSASDLKKLLSDPTGASTPDCPTDSLVSLMNGVVSSAIKAMTEKGNRFGLEPTEANPDVYEPSNEVNPLAEPPGTTYADTEYLMPVFDKTKVEANNPETFNQMAIVGFISAKIVRVSDSPENTIDLYITGVPKVARGYGGGIYLGVLSVEPKLVWNNPAETFK